ncbi:MAG: hypothetical protein KDK39_11930 [Leptospiraceae bacterium]|nr:hypothetical protein [Leptospiraceae bacterium]
MHSSLVAENGIPEGFKYLGTEGQTVTLDYQSDIAYGANGKWEFKTKEPGRITISNQWFGTDPLPGIPKKAYYRPHINGTSANSTAQDIYEFMAQHSGFKSRCTTVPCMAMSDSVKEMCKPIKDCTV